ncbi:hypothetical protein CDAR_480661 [Caerostris darwini]|uniref:Uncharacterized protein n=1 Tax=Caerostris darwini TaxID=1538125 RepID=A0AAV4RZH3_9ARAC|nr:hypothetical protein CDAR_480661 [Caerostris darwini]
MLTSTLCKRLHKGGLHKGRAVICVPLTSCYRRQDYEEKADIARFGENLKPIIVHETSMKDIYTEKIHTDNSRIRTTYSRSVRELEKILLSTVFLQRVFSIKEIQLQGTL